MPLPTVTAPPLTTRRRFRSGCRGALAISVPELATVPLMIALPPLKVSTSVPEPIVPPVTFSTPWLTGFDNAAGDRGAIEIDVGA